MQIPIVIETLPGNRFRAKSTTALPMMVEGNSAEEWLRLWQDTFSSVLPDDAEVVAVEPPVPPTLQPLPFAKFIGTLKNDQLVELWREGVAEYRRQRDCEDGIE